MLGFDMGKSLAHAVKRCGEAALTGLLEIFKDHLNFLIIKGLCVIFRSLTDRHSIRHAREASR